MNREKKFDTRKDDQNKRGLLFFGAMGLGLLILLVLMIVSGISIADHLPMIIVAIFVQAIGFLILTGEIFDDKKTTQAEEKS